jgi:trigger factor
MLTEIARTAQVTFRQRPGNGPPIPRRGAPATRRSGADHGDVWPTPSPGPHDTFSAAMQITIEDISPVEKRVDFEVPWRDVVPKLDKAYDHLRKEARLKGFRPGKAPRSIIERLYRTQVEDEVARELVELSLGQAIEENQIQPVAPPRVDKLELKAGEPFRFSARVEVRSQIVPQDYSGVSLSRRAARVTDQDVATSLEGYRRQLTQFMPVEGRALTADDDVLVVDVHGRIGEHKVKKNGVMVDLADENAGGVPGLATRLRGVPVDSAHLEVRYEVPADAVARSLAGKEVNLHVAIKEARERKQPAIDDELAKDTGEADTLAELEQKIRDRLLEADRHRIKQEMTAALAKELVTRNPFPIAPALVDRHAEALVTRARAQLMMAGIDLDDGAIDLSRMKDEVRGEAEQLARLSILVQAIAEREGVQVTDPEIQKRVAELATARQENAKKLRAELDRTGRIHGVRAQLLEEKTLDMLLAQAKITDEAPDRLIVTPEEAGARLLVTPEEARAEMEAARQDQGTSPRRK